MPCRPAGGSVGVVSGIAGAFGGLVALTWDSHDAHPRLRSVALGGLAAAVALAVVGLPPVDLHGPLHRAGIMDPLCGGTRSLRAALRGDLAGAWHLNPLGPVLVGGAMAVLARTVVGWGSGRWLTVRVAWRRPAVRAVLALAAALLAVNQQLHADVLR